MCDDEEDDHQPTLSTTTQPPTTIDLDSDSITSSAGMPHCSPSMGIYDSSPIMGVLDFNPIIVAPNSESSVEVSNSSSSTNIEIHDIIKVHNQSASSISTSSSSQNMNAPCHKLLWFKSYQQLLHETHILLDYPSKVLSDAYLATIGKSIYEPQTYIEAMSSLKASKSLEAMQCEYQSLITKKIWRLVLLPKRHWLVHNKWVYKIKFHANLHYNCRTQHEIIVV